MSKSKRFQSGREIFEHFIPNYDSENADERELSDRANQLAESLIGEFKGQIRGKVGRQAKRA